MTSKVIKTLKERPRRKPLPPLWDGPEANTPNGGITFSALSRFLCCRERFRVAMIEGLGTQHTFDHRIEYGHMFHLCDETHAGGGDWLGVLGEYVNKLLKEHPLQRPNVYKYWKACRVQFEQYLIHWKVTDKANKRKAVHQEWKFNVGHRLPSGRVVRLRGKTDGVYRLNNKLWEIHETKTKGEIDTTKMLRQLTFDLQTMMYTVALRDQKEVTDSENVKVTYNLVKRPLGQGSIRQLKPSRKNLRGESESEFYVRLGQSIGQEPEKHFQRFEALITPADVQRFLDKCLNPLLESLCQWYDYVKMMHEHPVPLGIFQKTYCFANNWVHPFGVRNILDEGGSTDLDEYLLTGVPVGLHRRDSLFTELK